jgi:hypothetical protein
VGQTIVEVGGVDPDAALPVVNARRKKNPPLLGLGVRQLQHSMFEDGLARKNGQAFLTAAKRRGGREDVLEASRLGQHFGLVGQLPRHFANFLQGHDVGGKLTQALASTSAIRASSGGSAPHRFRVRQRRVFTFRRSLAGVAVVGAARVSGFPHRHRRQVRDDLDHRLPDEGAQILAGRIVQPVNIVQRVVVELPEQPGPRVVDDREVDDPASGGSTGPRSAISTR